MPPTQDKFHSDAEHRLAVVRMGKAGHEAMQPCIIPYWDKEDGTVEDADGYRFVLQGAAWSS